MTSPFVAGPFTDLLDSAMEFSLSTCDSLPADFGAILSCNALKFGIVRALNGMMPIEEGRVGVAFVP